MGPNKRLRKTKQLMVRFSEPQRERLDRALALESERKGENVLVGALIRELVMQGVNRLLAEREPAPVP
jgi:hypothetical protein